MHQREANLLSERASRYPGRLPKDCLLYNHNLSIWHHGLKNVYHKTKFVLIYSEKLHVL